MPKAVGPLQHPDLHPFICEICGHKSVVPQSAFHRELPSCAECGSTVRHRQIVRAIAESRDATRQPSDFRVLGMSDHPLVSRYCMEQGFDYQNTYFDEAPVLDICRPTPDYLETADVLISSDVLEHVMFPIGRALGGMRRVIRPGGMLILTCPYVLFGPSTEHYPWMRDYVVQPNGSVIGIDWLGRERAVEDPFFHGGPGNTLEMRLLALDVLVDELDRAGFLQIQVHAESVPHLGIFPTDNMGVVVALAGSPSSGASK